MSNLLEKIKWLRLCILTTFRLNIVDLGSVVRDNIFLIVGDDLMNFSISLYHFLMMASALDWTPWFNLSGHQTEDPTESSCLFWFKSMEVLFNEGNVFDSLAEIPHPLLLVPFLIMALPNILEFLSLYQQQRPAGPALNHTMGSRLVWHCYM